MYPPYLHKIICGSSNTEKYASGGGVKDFAAVYNEVVAEVMSKLNTDMASAKQIVDSEETWLKDMVEFHGETNADYLAEHMLDSEKGEHKHKTGGGVHGKILKQNNTHKAVREGDKIKIYIKGMDKKEFTEAEIKESPNWFKDELIDTIPLSH